jgi:deoxyribonuclease IV
MAMPLLGAHMSIAGGHHHALEAAAALGMEACQLFSKSNQQWRAAPLVPVEVQRFQSLRKEKRIVSAVAHASYLINLATADPVLHAKSTAAVIEELQRAEALGLEALILHPGVATDDDVERGIGCVADAINTAMEQTSGLRVQLLLETTAGQGRSLGHTFDQLGEMLKHVKEAARIGVCLDTCHVFAAGYPLAARKDYLKTFKRFDDVIGLERLKVFHLNDSKKPLGSRVDRHEHIGQGQLGLEAFKHLLQDKRFRDHPMILETPKEGADGTPADPVNLQTLHELLS